MRFSHIENRIEQQLALKELITNAVDNLTKIGESNVTSLRVSTRLSALKESWEKFSINHEAINLSIKEVTKEERLQLLQHSYFSDNLFSSTYECYLESLERMNDFLDKDSEGTIEIPSTQSTPQSSNIPVFFHHTRLPRIDIPKFNGSPSEWLSFKDLFTSLILDNPTLSSVEKLQYLKTSLTGSAFHLLKNTSLTGDNFQKAWEALISFYENKRLLVNTALQSLMTLKRMSKESAVELEYLYTNITQIYRTLETLNRPVHNWDDIFVFIVAQRLDSESVKAWEHHLGASKEPPTWHQLQEFLLSRLLSLQAFEKSRTGKVSASSHSNAAKSHFQGKAKETHSLKPSLCSLCSSNHYITKCPQYSSKSIQQRLAIINKRKLCYNCLGSHRVSECRITKRCIKCGHKHHTTIHQNHNLKKSTPTSATSASMDSTATNGKSTQTQVLHSSMKPKLNNLVVFLATAQILLITNRGEKLKIRALIDQGSEISLISERIVQLLHLPRIHSSIALYGIGGQKANKTKGSTNISLRSQYNQSSEISISVHILPKLTASLPSVHIQQQSWPHLERLLLADPDYKSPGSIDLILGADVYSQIIDNGIVKGEANSPIAQKTIFGWIISGPANCNISRKSSQGYHISVDRQLYDLLQRFWKLEEVSSSTSSSLSINDQECERHFQLSHSRDSQGKYTVRLPFKESTSKLGESRTRAHRIIKNLSKRFINDPNYEQAYSEFLSEYEKLGHMKLIPDSQPKPEVSYYLPHHGVIRESSSTTRLRVVFNGSSHTSSGVSLNDLLHTGNKLQIDVFDVLIWFRQFRYVFSSDIEKMYRQIKIHQEDQKFQRILWINQDKDIVTYELTTVTYGLACAPFLALRTLSQLVDDEGANYPLAIPSLTQGRYVDDIFGGADSIPQAQEIVRQLNLLCMAGGFPLQKWTSNHTSILEAISPERQTHSTSVRIEDSPMIHVLGLYWNPYSDTFHFFVNSSIPSIMTKRNILSTVAKIFDPLGFLSPVTITAKLFIQELWSIKLAWDDPLPVPASTKWILFLKQLQDIPKLSFSRWTGFNNEHDFEIHGFCDASLRAMCATVYIRSSDQEGNVSIYLICAKTKVAPLKRMTIPRLELSAAVLLTDLISRILQILKFNLVPLFLWTDSAIVHTWINNHPSRWKEFIHNRVCHIHDTLPQAIWKLTPGTDNPADLATRGLTPTQLYDNTIWISGPHWLKLDASAWPQESQTVTNKEKLEERIKHILVTNVNSKQQWDLIYKYSSLTRLLRITALCMRVISRFRRAQSSSTIPITTHELELARLYWVKSTQQSSFSQELNIISKGNTLPSSHRLLRLTPFLDSQGLLRIGGRLHSSLLLENAKHPLILPKESPFTSLIIDDAHRSTMHGATQITLSVIRNNYWIIGGRAPIRSFILKCVRCSRFRKKRAQQIMGQLPPERVIPSRPFINSGVDYAGPFLLKNWKGRNSRKYKAWIALFICLSTSAIHIELVTDCTTDSFIAAYKRFSSRRGICSTLMSDCGTNLKGADSELRNLLSASSKE